MRRQRGLLVAIEGIDGAGKSTLVTALARRLRAHGLSVAVRHEPADRRLGRLAQAASVSDPWTGAVYFTLDRWLARSELEGALHRYRVVLTDRSYFSTLAYQGSALPPAARRRLAALQRVATVPPDRVIWIDLPPAEAVRRLRGRGTARAPLERRRTLERVAAEYRRLARGPGWVRVDGSRPRSEIVAEASRAVRIPGRSRS